MMDRSLSASASSTSNSRRASSEFLLHGRQQSLTSACPPVTANLVPNSPNLSPNLGPANAFASSPVPVQRSWKVYDWSASGSSNSASTTPPSPSLPQHQLASSTSSTASSSSSASHAHAHASKKLQQRHAYPSLAIPLTPNAILQLPTTLLSFIFPTLLQPSASSPTSSSNHNSHHHHILSTASPISKESSINSGTINSQAQKRWPFPIRLLTISYLIFSVLFFGIRLASWGKDGAFGTANNKLLDRPPSLGDSTKLGPRDAQPNPNPDNSPNNNNNNNKGWAQRVAGGVKWGKALGAYGGRFAGAAGNAGAVSADPELADAAKWETVRRTGEKAFAARTPETNPLTAFTHTYRFAKMHDKIHWDLPDEIEPYLFRATRSPDPSQITACLYSNEAWIATLPAFVRAWRGPISLVFEAAHSRNSPHRADLITALADLRATDPLIRENVDFHLVGTPASASTRTLNKTRERFISHPIAQNFHVNLARFFAGTDTIFVVGDARVVPSQGLHDRLVDKGIQDLVLSRGDAVVVPTFGFVRDPTGEAPTSAKVPSIHDLRETMGLPASGPWDGVGEDEFPSLAKQNVESVLSTLPLAQSDWPTKKSQLVSLVSTRVGTADAPTSARLALFDRGWDLNHGPTNWYLWRKASTDPRLLEAPEMGGGVGLGIGGAVGGGRDVFRVTDYDLHYSPHVVMSRKGQPWCTERFEHMHAACVYQMYLSGAEMWVLPDEWLFTLEGTEKPADGPKEDPAQKLKNSISSRLYGKFHQEACMHYGREFLSVQMWDSDKAQHLRSVCARTLGTWGMGSAN
ncbi:hypothetical protein T439DRAFT_329545 [Meredithblackwellia eburnea MCA 4105]